MKILNYKKGDFVRIRHVAQGEQSGGYIFTEGMKQYCGTVSEIIKTDAKIIKLECTGLKIAWVPKWVEPDFLPDKLFEI